MKTQFVYKRKIEMPPVKEDTERGIIGADGYTKTVYDSFNIDCVIRSITMDDGSLLVLLNDLHERTMEKPKFNSRGKMTGMHRVKETYQSEIQLSPEEGKDFLKTTSINNYE